MCGEGRRKQWEGSQREEAGIVEHPRGRLAVEVGSPALVALG